MKITRLREETSVEVFQGSSLAGILSRTERGAKFEYDSLFREKALRTNSSGISYSLPPTNAAYKISGSNLHSFFAGLLPEGLRLKALRQTLKTSEDDLFSMLLALGSNCIGDVWIQAGLQNELSTSALQSEEDIAIQSWDKVSFLELFWKSIASEELGAREREPGIPGVIPKISASMVSFPLSFKKRHQDCILKLETNEHPQLLENEHFFMRLANRCGLITATTSLVRDRDGATGLLIERFDREYEKSTKQTHRLHQEDACQLLGRYPQDKYRLTLREIAEGRSQRA